MSYHEYVGNLHIHTPYSDGTEYHQAIADAARQAGLHFIVVTDHNIIVQGVEGYYGDDQSGYVLVLTGEEIHDRFRLPQVNHCLVYNIKREMCEYAPDPQKLINAVRKEGGLTFLAHPYDQLIPWQPPDSDGIGIPWVDWNVKGFTGLEIWNYMSSWKETLPTVRKSLKSVFRPEETMIAPPQAILDHWDRLLESGQHVVGIGNSDAHGTYLKMGPFKHRIYPYDFLFSCVNTHILTKTPLIGELDTDRKLLFDALKEGRAYIGYDFLASTRNFRFTATGEHGNGIMGDMLRLGAGVTLQTLAPERGLIKMIHFGKVMYELENADTLTYTARESGAYRVEIWKEYKGVMRCWILSNPIYIVG